MVNITYKKILSATTKETALNETAQKKAAIAKSLNNPSSLNPGNTRRKKRRNEIYMDHTKRLSPTNRGTLFARGDCAYYKIRVLFFLFFAPPRIPHQILDLARLQLSRVPLIRGSALPISRQMAAPRRRDNSIKRAGKRQLLEENVTRVKQRKGTRENGDE